MSSETSCRAQKFCGIIDLWIICNFSFGLLTNAIKHYYRSTNYKLRFPFSLIAILVKSLGLVTLLYCMRILYKRVIIFCVRFSVFITVNMQIAVFWNVTSCCLVERYSSSFAVSLLLHRNVNFVKRKTISNVMTLRIWQTFGLQRN
jgi:hypothetical protein